MGAPSRLGHRDLSERPDIMIKRAQANKKAVFPYPSLSVREKLRVDPNITFKLMWDL